MTSCSLSIYVGSVFPSGQDLPATSLCEVAQECLYVVSLYVLTPGQLLLFSGSSEDLTPDQTGAIKVFKHDYMCTPTWAEHPLKD